MKTLLAIAAICLLPACTLAQNDAKTDAALEAIVDATFAKASPEWQAQMKPDATIATCNAYRDKVPAAEAAIIEARERARVVLPSDGNVLGNWKDGFMVANNGRGGQFSDPPGTVAGGNCYACHQMDPLELSHGTLGPSLKGYGRERKFDVAEAKNAFVKIYDSQAVAACSSMPRFGTNKVLSERQIMDLVAYLFDPESPVNK